VDLALGVLGRRSASLALVQPSGSSYELVFLDGTHVVDAFALSDEVATAAIVRLAALAGLDPIAEANTPEGDANVVRLRTRVDGAPVEILVSLVSRGDALEAELRLLSVSGTAPSTARAASLRRCACGAFDAAPRVRCQVDGGILTDVVDDVEVGGVLGTYLLGNELGRGGMGRVFDAKHALLDRRVAIKVMNRSPGDDPSFGRRFFREARAASRLRHPRLVEVTDFGLSSDGHPYMVMEHVEGESVEARLLREKTLTPALALLIAREIASGLAAAHAGGVVHNDIKPSNVMIARGSSDDAPRVKVVDFGAVSILGAATDAEIVLGTPHYMAPESIRGAPTDARADLYALGITLFEMITGNVPFDGATPSLVFLGHLEQPPPALVSPRGPLPKAVVAVVTRLLRKSPDERHQTADEVVAHIDRALDALKLPLWKKWFA
jgi:serine/threonine-protein kinase